MKKTLPLPDYPVFLAALKERILQARTSAARAVNRDLVLLYWDIGRGIVEKQQTAGWGEAVVERLARDLRSAFPDMRGFSVANLWRMKQFYLTHTAPEFLSQAVRELKCGKVKPEKLAQAVREFGPAPRSIPDAEFLAQAVRELIASIPWGHHVYLLARLADPAARFYYLRATAQLGWSRNVLINQIKGGAYERAVTEKKTHNFPLALPEHFAEQADEMMKSRYNLEFLGIGRAMKERELEDRLIGRLQQFILELGYGFCFVGRQYRLVLGRKEYFVDLLFYHRLLKALVAFDLKGSDQWLVTSGQKGGGQWRVGNGWKPATDHWPLVTKHWPLANAVREVSGASYSFSKKRLINGSNGPSGSPGRKGS